MQNPYSCNCQDDNTYNQLYFDLENGEHKEQPTIWLVNPTYKESAGKLRYDFRGASASAEAREIGAREITRTKEGDHSAPSGSVDYPFALVFFK